MLLVIQVSTAGIHGQEHWMTKPNNTKRSKGHDGRLAAVSKNVKTGEGPWDVWGLLDYMKGL